ncbi:hypothetical protein MMC07_006419 [Pseudocyphellaria aurata]|nr:hypothetical protein [Pseudocyphellaria aurata]
MAPLVGPPDFMTSSNMSFVLDPLLMEASHLPPPSPRPNLDLIIDPLLVQDTDVAPQSPHSFSPTSSGRSSILAIEASEEEHPTDYQISPPPEQVYPNPKVAEDEIHAWSKAMRYEMSRTKSDKNKDGLVYKQYYKCARHGKPSNSRKSTEEGRIRHGTKSRRTGCPMGVVVKAVDPKAPEGQWKLQHHQNGKSFTHNHPPAPDPSASSSHRHRACPEDFKMAPPPEQEYPNPKVAEEEIHAWTKAFCYKLSRTKGDKNKDGVVYKQYYKCSKHGKPSNTRKLTDETRVRHVKSRRTGCPMGIVVKAVDPKAPEGLWKIQHQMNGKSFVHNHPPALDAIALSGHSRRVRSRATGTALTSDSASGAS